MLVLHTQRVQVPNIEDSDPKNHTLNGFWDQSPETLGYLDPLGYFLGVQEAILGLGLAWKQGSDWQLARSTDQRLLSLGERERERERERCK